MIFIHKMKYYDIVTELYESGFIRNYFLKVSFESDRQNADDEIQEIILQLLEYGQKLEEMYDNGGLDRCRKYVSGLIYRQLHSKTSKIYYKYKRWTQNAVPFDETIMNKIDKIDENERGGNERND